MRLTANEHAVLVAIDNSEYGDLLTDAVWTFTLADNMSACGPTGNALSGTVSSLSQKGFLETYKCSGSTDWQGFKNNDDSTVTITAAGVEALLESGYKPKKLLALPK